MGMPRFFLFSLFLLLLGTSLAHAADDKIPDDVVAEETDICLKQATKTPAWFGSVYCPCVMKETQAKISYTDYQAVSQELKSGNTAGRPAFERNKDAMESIAKTCMVLVEKRLIQEQKMGMTGDR